MASEARLLYVVPHSHIDVEWYWTIATTHEWTSDILHRALALLRQDEAYRFTQDQTVLLKGFWEELDTDEREFLRQMVVEGRFAIVGGTYVQPEVAEPSGESLIRNILLGQEWLEATFGIRARCGWFIDTFGQIPQMPQILSRAGYRYNVFWRDIPPELGFDAMPADFYWQAPDGTRLLTHWMPGGYSDRLPQLRLILARSNTHHFMLPHGGDVVRPTQTSDQVLQEVQSHLQELGRPEGELRVASALEYLDAVATEAGNLPVLNHDFNPPLLAHDLRGTYDNRVELKVRNRAVEQALLNAEAIATIAYAAGYPYPAEALSEQWERLLFTQFHDTIGGSNSDPVYTSAMERLAGVLASLEVLSAGKLRELATPAGERGEWVVVFNSLSFRRSEVCRLRLPASWAKEPTSQTLESSDGHPAPLRIVGEAAPGDTDEVTVEFVATEMPATGYRTYRLRAGNTVAVLPPNRATGANRIENAFFRLEWSPGAGDLISIWDKARQRELLSGPGNVFLAAREENPDMEGNIYLTGEVASSSDYRVTGIEIAQDAVALRVRMQSDFQDCRLVREVALPDFSPRLDLTTTVEDFRGGDVLLKVSFPLRIDWRRAERVYETPFAATPRAEGHYAAQTWVDCSDGDYGVTLLNRGNPGYWIENGRLELVLLRSLANYTSYQRHGLAKRVPGYEASTQMELAREHGTHQFHYSLYPHAGRWCEAELSRVGQSLNTPLVAIAGLGETCVRNAGKSFLAFGPDFVMTALKCAQNGEGVVVRGFETRGLAHKVTMTVPSWAKRVLRASLLEESGEELAITDGAVILPCAPHEIVTLLLVP